MYKVSIIMPIYNNEETLRPVIEAILNQTVSGFELILINDGSTDASTQICEEYAKKEPLLIEVIHQARTGFAQARNRGLNRARGAYIYFADAQTILGRRMLESNLQLIEEQNAELVVFGFNRKEENTQVMIEHIPKLPFLLSKERFRNHFRNFHYFFPYELCNKLFEMKYLRKHGIKFGEHSLKEKYFFNLDVYQNLSRVVFNRKVFCQKWIVDNNKTQQYQENLLEKNLELIKQFKKMLTAWGLIEEYSDLVMKEYLNLLESEVLNYMNPPSQLSNKELETRIGHLLNNPQILVILNEEKNITPQNFYEKALWNYFRNRNTRGIIRIIRRKNQTNKITSNIKDKLRQWFN